jgi:hypothetical protein
MPDHGVGDAWISCSSSTKPPGRIARRPERSFRLAPAQKVEPVLVTTRARIEASALATRSASRRPCTRAPPRALRFGSSTSVAVITPRSVCTSTGFMGPRLYR